MLVARYTRIQTIAVNTCKEAVRQKFFGLLVVLASSFVVGANFLSQFDFGGSELKFIADFGWGAIFLFGTLLAIVATSQLFFSEIEHRTALTLLAKPVPRWEFILGKFAGIGFLLTIFTTVLVVLFMGMVYLSTDENTLSSQGVVCYPGFVMTGMLQWVRFLLVSATTLFICSFSNTNFFAVMLSFLVLLICQLQYIARDYWSAIDMLPLKYSVMLISLIFPNYQMFNVGDSLLFKEGAWMPLSTIIGIVGYGLIYVIFLGLMAVWCFRKRDF